MNHPADRIIASVQAALAGTPGATAVHVVPVFMLDKDDLPCIVIDELRVDIEEQQRGRVTYTRQKLSFRIKPVVAANKATLAAVLGALHQAVHDRLLSSIEARTLGGLLFEGLECDGEQFFGDAESLEIPVAGWSVGVFCFYSTRSDRPGLFDKELS